MYTHRQTGVKTKSTRPIGKAGPKPTTKVNWKRHRFLCVLFISVSRKTQISSYISRHFCQTQGLQIMKRETKSQYHKICSTVWDCSLTSPSPKSQQTLSAQSGEKSRLAVATGRSDTLIHLQSMNSSGQFVAQSRTKYHTRNARQQSVSTSPTRFYSQANRQEGGELCTLIVVCCECIWNANMFVWFRLWRSFTWHAVWFSFAKIFQEAVRLMKHSFFILVTFFSVDYEFSPGDSWMTREMAKEVIEFWKCLQNVHIQSFGLTKVVGGEFPVYFNQVKHNEVHPRQPVTCEEGLFLK